MAPKCYTRKLFLVNPQRLFKDYLIWFCRNRSAENLYGYTASEALGQNAIELLVDVHDFNIASNIVRRVTMGESWKGNFPVKNKLGECFLSNATNTPFYDDDGSLVGIICVSSDSRSFQDLGSPPTSTKSQASVSSTASFPRKDFISNGGSDPQQPLQIAIASKITNLVSVTSCNFMNQKNAIDAYVTELLGSILRFRGVWHIL